MSMLVDTFNRAHRDLRVSITDRCNLRCTYCMPPDFSDWLPGDHLLSVDELLLVIEVATEQGIAACLGRSQADQARNIIHSAAHPSVRDELEERAREFGLF